jgi:transcriptional regulator of met regulon
VGRAGFFPGEVAAIRLKKKTVQVLLPEVKIFQNQTFHRQVHQERKNQKSFKLNQKFFSAAVLGALDNLGG